MTSLYVGGIPYTTSNDDLAEYFRPFGVVSSIEIVSDRMTGRSKGFGFVEFSDPSAAASAAATLHATEFQGRRLTVQVAKVDPIAVADVYLAYGRDLLAKEVLKQAMRTNPSRVAIHFKLLEIYAKRRDAKAFEAVATEAYSLTRGEGVQWEHVSELRREFEPPPLADFLCDRKIIEVSSGVSLALIKHFQTHPTELRNIDRRRFEELVAEIWSGFGYVVELTQQTRDGGVDVVAVRHSFVAERYLIECKRPNPGKPIGVRPVRELYGVLANQRATKAILATTAHFSKDAIVFIESNKWQLEGRDFDGLMEWIDEYVQRKA